MGAAVYDRLAERLPDVKHGKLAALCQDAEGMVLAYTGRRTLPAALETAAVQLAVVLYNREGTEGETGHSEGGVSRTMDGLPAEIERQLRPYRLAQIVRMHT